MYTTTIRHARVVTHNHGAMSRIRGPAKLFLDLDFLIHELQKIWVVLKPSQILR
jgi:hypothetical protein